MPTIEERVAYLEGQVSEHANAFVETREAIRHLEHRMDIGFEAVERRFAAMDQRLDTMNERFETRFETLNQRFVEVDQKMSRQFVWLVGMQMTTILAVVGPLLARG